MLEHDPGRSYLHLNAGGSWGGFEWVDLELGENGALGLCALPRPERPPPTETEHAAVPDGPAGVAVTPDRTLFFTEPDRDRLLRQAPCDGGAVPAPCAGGSGSGPGEFRRPRGLAYHPARDALVLADAGNHRLQLLDARDARVLGVWGQSPGTAPGPRPEPGRFDTPWAVAVDQAGFTYVVDHGNRRVQKLDIDGRVVDGFRRRVEAEGSLSRPVDVTVLAGEEGPEVLVLDLHPPAVVVLQSDGGFLRRTERTVGEAALGLAVSASSMYVGDNGRRRLVRLLADGTSVGDATGYDGPVAALAVDGIDRLWVHPGPGHVPLPFAMHGAHVRSGAFWAGPFSAGEVPHEWQQLRVSGDPPPPGTAVEFAVHLADDPASGPGAPQGPDSTFASPWKSLPQRGFHGLIGGTSRYLWLGGRLSGDRDATAQVEQIRVDYDSPTWIDHLPAIYRKEESSRRDLGGLLSLTESLFDDVESQAWDLPRHFDPATAPSDWLGWLAGWLALEISEGRAESGKRAAIAGAFEAYGRAGTREGLRDAVRRDTGLPIVVEEPIRRAAWWLLPDPAAPSGWGSQLGVSTVLAASQPDGAVIGSTAVADRSHLTTGADYGAPLFDDVAFRFTVSVYDGPGLTEELLAELRRVVEAERPAHTDSAICVIEPRMRVGYQAILGIDTIVAPVGANHDPDPHAPGLRLGGESTGQLGTRSEIGTTTRLG